MRLRLRPSGPGPVLGLLAVACGVIAVVSVTRPTGPPDNASRTASHPAFDPSKVTRIHPKDAVPSLDTPLVLEDVSSVDWLDPREPVIALAVREEARAYPLRLLTWHEIANDRIGGLPVAVTYCPLCNTAIVFRRPKVGGASTSFGTSGLLYRSNLLMYDRATDSLWAQLTGLAMRGELAGSELLRLPVSIVAWRDFERAYPRAKVLSRSTGFDRPYGENPYPHFDSGAQPPPEIDLEVDDRLPALDRVLGVRSGGETTAFSFTRLSRGAGRDGIAVENVRVGGQPVVVIYKAGTRSATGARDIAKSRAVGTAVAYSSTTGGRTLRFTDRDGRVVDAATGSTWNVFGTAIAGPLRGTDLTSVDRIEAFWYQWAAFHPKTEVWEQAGR